MLSLEFQIAQNTEASVHLFENSSVFGFVAKTAKFVSIFSVVRVHLSEQNDPFGHTQP